MTLCVINFKYIKNKSITNKIYIEKKRILLINIMDIDLFLEIIIFISAFSSIDKLQISIFT